MLFTGLTGRYIDEEFKGEQKFIVSRHLTDSPRMYLFDFYAVDLWPDSDEEPTHEKIVRGFELKPESVLGGGRIKRASPGEILLYGSSATYGGVPRKFLEFFKSSILGDYKRKFPGIDRIIIDTPKKTKSDDKVSFLDKMRE